MTFDPRIYRNIKDGIGAPADERATSATDAWTVVSLLKGLYTLLSGTITVTNPVGAATAANQATEISSLASIDGHVDGLETLAGTGNAALAAILAKIIAAPSTEAKQDAIVTALGLLGTQTTLAAVLAKLIAAPSTEAKQDTGNTSLASIASLLTTQAGYLDGIEGLITATNAKDFATQTTLAAVLAKIIAAPATEAKQDTGNTSLASILAKIIAAPATEAKQDSAITQETAINTVLGTTAGAAVTTSVAGTIQGYLRGMISLLVSGITVATHAVTQSGTWTVQPGNTANTTAWKTDGSAVTQPTSLADNASVTFGAKADAKSTATDTTSITAMSVWKQISASVQSLATGAVLAAGSAIIGKVGIDQTSGQNLTKHVRSATGTQSNVASSASSVTILASNASRLGATVYNDSTAILYLLLGSATASSTVHTVQMQAATYFEVPAFYTGQLTGIWATATGSARVTELT